jgi:hypothetical protein
MVPSITANLASTVGCVGTPLSVTASALQTNVNSSLTYEWFQLNSSAPYVDYYNAISVSPPSSSPTYTPTVAGRYFCRVKGGSCSWYNTPVVTVNDLPSVNASAGTCSGSNTADITGTISGATAPYSINWTGGSSTLNPAGNFSIIGLSSGTYNITVTDANGCSTSIPTPITINCGSSCTNPTIDTQPTDITECLNAAQQLSVTATGATLTYQWYSNTTNSTTGIDVTNLGSSNGAQTATYTPPSGTAGTIYYFVIVNSTTCATTSNPVTVVVNPNNTAATPPSSTTVCLNAAIAPSITITTTGATGITNDGVSGANVLPAGVSATWASNTITISGTPTVSGTFNYSILLTGGCGTVNATGTITVQTQPSIIFLSPP